MATNLPSPMQNLPTSINMASIAEDEMAAEADEPPDFTKRPLSRSNTGSTDTSPTSPSFGKSRQAATQQPRRESLLTQAITLTESQMQLHNTTHKPVERSPHLRTNINWSTASSGSMAELTSDDGLTSPGMRTSSPSPPLPPHAAYHLPPAVVKPLDQLAHDEQLRRSSVVAVAPIAAATTGPQDSASEKTVEAALGRKRCISFACGKKDPPAADSTPNSTTSAPVVAATEAPAAAAPAPRKCALRFVCPTRATAEATDAAAAQPAAKAEGVSPKTRATSPPPPARHHHRRRSSTSRNTPQPHHRGSNATLRRSSASGPSGSAARPQPRKQPTEDELGHTAANTFHEFYNSESEEEEWLVETTCHKSRLTLDDTLSKEREIRQTCVAATEEDDELEEDEIDNEEDDDEDVEADLASSQVVSLFEDDDETDDGFHSDDEHGFASSEDDEADESDEDFAWWAPRRRSTAATSVDDLEALNKLDGCTHIRPNTNRNPPSTSSIGSPGASDHKSSEKKYKPKPKPIDIRPGTPDLPDSTDFVCGTFDEDRPLEEAWLQRKEQRKAKKLTPQDIDPSFPTSDPEMEEEDEDDEDDYSAAQESDHPIMHGHLEITDGEVRGRSVREWRRQSQQMSRASPAARAPSPAPIAEHPTKPVHRSPPPPTMSRRSTNRSPPPPTSRRSTNRSPPPPLVKRSSNTSNTSANNNKNLFGQSPRRHRSPAKAMRLASPPNSRNGSFDEHEATVRPKLSIALAQRPRPQRTASLPRTPNPLFAKVGSLDVSDSEIATTRDNRRGAIDIVKGLERKRQRRKEKLAQKACTRGHKKEDKKCKPGKGAQKMREVGLEMAAYKKGCTVIGGWGFGGKGGAGNDKSGEYILSV